MAEATVGQTRCPEDGLVVLESVRRVFADADGIKVHALSGVSLRIDVGEFVCVTGPSGSGKSTLLNVLGCLDGSFSGTYRFAGTHVGPLNAAGLAELRLREIGFVFQSYHLLESVTAIDNVAVPADYVRWSRRERRRRAGELLSAVGLGDKLDRRPAELSGGEQQRACVARALMNGARLILADEPTGALDSKQGREVLDLLADLASRGHSVVVVSHDASVAARADRRIELVDGRVIGDSGAAPCAVRSPGALSLTSVRRRIGGLGSLASAARAIKADGIRTAVVALAATLSVSLVVALLAMVEGTYGSAMAMIADMGANRVQVAGYSRIPEGDPAAGQFRTVEPVQLTEEDVRLIESRIANVNRAYPLLSRNLPIGRGDDRIHNVVVFAQLETTPRALLDVEWELERGSFLTEADSEGRHQVAVVGPTVVKRLFGPGVDPVGRHITIDGRLFQVKGVLGPYPRSPEEVVGKDSTMSDQAVSELMERWEATTYVPFKTAAEGLFGSGDLDGIDVVVEDASRVEETATEIRELLVLVHGREGVVASVKVTLAEAQRALSGLNVTVVLGIGCAVLVAAGLTMMSVMWAAVDSRKREIGLRMALGARGQDISMQFLAESVLVVVTGSAAGVILGYGGAPVVSSVTDVPLKYANWFVPAALGCAIVTGFIFGIVPARRAARLDPAAVLASD